MFVLRPDTTEKFLQELRNLNKIPESQEDREKYKNSKKIPSTVKKLYDNDTSKFEPIEENREHLIKSVIPLVYKIAISESKRYFVHRIELDDCVSAGMIGAVISADKYIKNAGKHTAKFSTVAYSDIKKSIQLYGDKHNNLLDCELTKWRQVAADYIVKSGNEMVKGHDNSTAEYFDICKSSNLINDFEDDTITNDLMEDTSKKLFSLIDSTEKNILFMSFGIGTRDGEPISTKHISTELGLPEKIIKSSIKKSITKIKSVFSGADKMEIFNILNNVDKLSCLPSWSLKY